MAQTPTDAAVALSVQERLYPRLPCFGCGQGNPKGLQLKSYPLEGKDGVVASFTAGLDVRYLRPAPLREPVELHAAVTEAAEPQMTVAVELRFDGKVRAEARAVWKRWRPRP